MAHLALKLLLIRLTIEYDDKAKLRAIGGRKATGPIGIAGLPKQRPDLNPWRNSTHGFFI